MDAESSREIVFRLPLRVDSDVAQARMRVRQLCTGRGFPSSEVEALVTATSEVARNVIVHAGDGEVLIGTVVTNGRAGVVVVTRDSGPGIPNIERAMCDGFSTGSGLGFGLPSARRLVPDFDLQSVVAEGTTVTLTLWLGALRES
jgi:serine/threonine-protein kinase RsbT